MSATLPMSRRDALLRTWGIDSNRLPDLAYPRVLLADNGGLRGEHFAARPLAPIRLAGLGEELEALAAQALAGLAEGGCGAVIVNTVDRAQKLYLMLRERLGGRGRLLLFHARFPANQRAALEREMLGLFGPQG